MNRLHQPIATFPFYALNPLLAFVLAALTCVGAAALDAAAIGNAMGMEAGTTPDGVIRVTWGRADVPVTIDGYPLQPFAGLTSWAAFKETDGGARVMGDTVVFQDEVGPAMDAAIAAGIEITALHNHFFYDDPPVYFMHIGGSGDPQALARGVKAMWDAIREVRSNHDRPQQGFAGPTPDAGTVSAEDLEQVLGLKANVKDGMVKFSVGREADMDGLAVGGSMGLTTWMAFSGNDTLAVVDGDFIMEGDEVQRVLKALRRADIQVVALHNHMIGEEPAYYFAHFWGKGAPLNLARALRAALVVQGGGD